MNVKKAMPQLKSKIATWTSCLPSSSTFPQKNVADVSPWYPYKSQ